MELRRVRPSDWLTGAFGAVLLASLFLEWYDTPAGPVEGWEAFSVTDVLLSLPFACGLALVALTALRRAPALPVAAGVIATTVGVLVFALSVIRHVNEPGANGEVSVSLGAYVGLASSLGFVLASWLALRDESAPGISEARPVEVLEPPPAQAAS